jgi:hypothetical protein
MDSDHLGYLDIEGRIILQVELRVRFEGVDWKNLVGCRDDSWMPAVDLWVQ